MNSKEMQKPPKLINSQLNTKFHEQNNSVYQSNQLVKRLDLSNSTKELKAKDHTRWFATSIQKNQTLIVEVVNNY